MDYVAHVIRQTLDHDKPYQQLNQTLITSYTGHSTDTTPLKFILFASFQSQKDSIGLELCRAFDQYCQSRGIGTFELRTRFTGDARWDEWFIRQELETFSKLDLQKVWVCGPPPMSEVFDKTFSKILAEGQQGITQEMLEVI